LACDPSKYFIFNSILLKCVCAQGFKESHQIGLLPTCQPVCGDGIIVPDFEDCDDKNTENEDGCDSDCKF
jgi:cysteine-rich repeat protein